jgi:serpin B
MPAQMMLSRAAMSRTSSRASLSSALLVLAMGGLAACTTSSNGDSTTSPASSNNPPADGPVAQSSLPRSTAPAVKGDAETLTSDNTAFAADVYRTLRTSAMFDKKNLFFSPHSISVALAMTYAGARGTTQTEMASALHFTLPQERLHPAFNALDLALSSRGTAAKATDGSPFKLRATNSLWGLPNMPFEQPFLDTLSQNYGAGIRLTNFSADPEGSRKTINDWVSEKTETRIPELLPEHSINALTRLVLVNAVYFNAAWAHPFDTLLTKAGTFRGLQGDVSASFMSTAGSLGHTRGADFDAVALPYDGNELQMIAILPDDGKLDAVENRLDGAMLGSIASALTNEEVELRLPKFEIKGSSFSLKDTLTALGMKTAFSSTDADFTGMLSRTVDSLYIGDVVHDAFVSVDEKGTEAAAATAVEMLGGAAMTPTVKVTIDRPFIFGIRDIATGTFVFLGRVAQP